MEKEFWHQRWEMHDVGFHQQQPNAFLQAHITQLQLQTGQRILVPLCGKSMDMLWLAQHGFEVVGVELSPIAGAEFFREHALDFQQERVGSFDVYRSGLISLWVGDFFDLKPELLGRMDAVYDRAALIALPEPIRNAYAHHLTGLLTPQNAMLLLTCRYPPGRMSGPPFSVDEAEVMRLYGRYFDVKKLYSESAASIPAHLQSRGLTQAVEEVYYLSLKSVPVG